MPRKPRAQRAKTQNAAQAHEAYKKVMGKDQKATEFEDEYAQAHCDPDNHIHNESPQEDPEIVEIISEFLHIQEDGYDPEIEDEELEDMEINMAGDDTYQFGLTSGGRGGKQMGDTIITSYLNT